MPRPRSADSLARSRIYALEVSRRAAEERWALRYQEILQDEGLPNTISFEDFLSVIRGQGAISAIIALAGREPERMVEGFSPDRADDLLRLINTAVLCLTEHGNVHSPHGTTYEIDQAPDHCGSDAVDGGEPARAEGLD